MNSSGKISQCSFKIILNQAKYNVAGDQVSRTGKLELKVLANVEWVISINLVLRVSLPLIPALVEVKESLRTRLENHAQPCK